MAITRNFSTQDGNLTGSVSGQQPVPYLDLDLSFQPKPSGDIYKKTDMQSVIQSVKNICLTNRFERPFQPNFGCDLESTLFDLTTDPITEDSIKKKLNSNLSAYEPRIRVKDIMVDISPETNSVDVSLTFIILNSNKTVSLTTTISRLR